MKMLSYLSIILVCNGCFQIVCMCSGDCGMFCCKFIEFMICNGSHKDVTQVDMDFYWAKYTVELFVHRCTKRDV